MLVQGLLRLCPGETFHESCAQTAGDLPVAFMKSFDCKTPIQVRAVLAGCTVHDIGPEAIPGFFLMFLAFWCVGVLAFWRSGSGGAEKLCAVDVKKTCSKGGDARYFKCAEIAFFEDKNRKRTGETTKGRACEPINV